VSGNPTGSPTYHAEYAKYRFDDYQASTFDECHLNQALFYETKTTTSCSVTSSSSDSSGNHRTFGCHDVSSSIGTET
jgi:hypothetical protein